MEFVSTACDIFSKTKRQTSEYSDRMTKLPVTSKNSSRLTDSRLIYDACDRSG